MCVCTTHDALVNNFDATNVIGKIAQPNIKNTKHRFPNSLGVDQPVSLNKAIVAINTIIVTAYIK